jgi:regulator of sigma E protease
MTSLLALLALAALIVVHELGHMFVARLAGMRVDKFSIGFGPTLLRWRGRKTTYQIALIPLGGFVQIAGMNPHEQVAADDPGSYANKTPSARFATILAGPLTNYVFSMVLMVGVMLTWGLPRWQNTLIIADVQQGRPAARGGLRAGDVVEAIDGHVLRSTEEAMAQIQASKGRPLQLRLRRGGQIVQTAVSPTVREGALSIGVHFGSDLTFSPLARRTALALGAIFPLIESQKALRGLKQLFSGKVSVKQVGGPVEILRQLKMSFEASLAMAIVFLAMLNVYLGLFNLLPVPALDGGRLVFLVYTMVSRRAVNQRVENAIHTVGFIVLLGLILVVTYRDIVRLFGG